MKKTIAAILLTSLFMAGCSDGTDKTKKENPSQYAGKLLILQAYGSANDAAGATHSFVELYNVTDRAVDLSGISLHYAAGHRKSDPGWDDNADKPWERIALNGTIPAQGSFLILGPRENETARYVIEDGYGDINDPDFTLYNRAFKVALVEGDKNLTVQNPFNIDGKGTKTDGYIDMVGAINTRPNAAESNNYDRIYGFETAPARCSASEAVRRYSLIDTDNNQGRSSEFPNGTGDFDSIRYGAGGTAPFISMTDEMLEVRRPRNSGAGSWDPFAQAAEPVPGENTLLIFQVHGAGLGEELGANSNINTGSISHNFIELYNNSDTAVDLSGYSVQWANGKANGGGTVIAADQDWNVIPLTGTIPAYGSYLIRGRKINDPSGGSVGRLQITEGDINTDDFYMSNRSFKVALMSNQNKITLSQPWDNVNKEPLISGLMDLVGARNGNNDSVEGFKGAMFDTYSKQQSIRRGSLIDTGNNKNDFTGLDYRTTGLSNEQAANFRPRTAAETADGYTPAFDRDNANPGVRDLIFSHASGVYNQAFSLTLIAQAGSTIYYSIDGSIPAASDTASGGPVFTYNSPIAIQNRNGQPNLLATAANVALMYPHPADPYEWNPQPYIPTANQVPKATVIRAIAVDSNGSQGDVITRTYFIGNNLAQYGNNPVLSIVTDPKNLLDYNIGIYVQGPGRSRYEYNYAQKGREWEREAYLDFFDGQGNVGFSAGMGIRIHGGWSRENGQKAFNVYFRDEYGLSNLRNYNLIPGAVQADGKTPVERYKSFMLRNGGNDTSTTKLRDVYIQSLLGDRNFTAQAGVPCILYLNGEYWGPYNLQEKTSDNGIEYKYGVNRDNVIAVKTGGLDEGVDSDMNLYWSMMDTGRKDMSIQANYDAFCNVVDIQSFIDYFAAEIYIYNEDWPQNNIELWRVRSVERGNHYGDGKWRWMMYDTEFSMGIYSGGSIDSQNSMNTFEFILNGPHRNHDNNKLFKNLISNDNFCRQFVITMMDLYNVNFEFNSTIATLDAMAAVYKPLMGAGVWHWDPTAPWNDSEMGTYYSRWGFPWDWFSFDDQINDMKKYLTDIRPAMTNNYLPRYFGHLGIASDKLYNVTLSAKNGSANVTNASITINTTTPTLRSGSWTGKYYSALPVTVTAHIPAGLSFTGWTVTGGAAEAPSAPTTTVTFTGNVQITANYR